MLRNDDGWLSLASVKYKGFRNQRKGGKKNCRIVDSMKMSSYPQTRAVPQKKVKDKLTYIYSHINICWLENMLT